MEPVISFSSENIIPVRRNRTSKRHRIENLSQLEKNVNQAPLGAVNDLSKTLSNMKVMRLKLIKDVDEAYKKNVRLKVCNCIDLKVNVAKQCNTMLLYATLKVLIDKMS